MKVRYILPCSCGEKHLVETAQAGERIRCRCGKELQAPTLLAMKRLPQAEQGDDRDSRPRKPWGAQQRLLLIGAVVVILGLGLSAFVHYRFYPRLRDLDDFRPIETVVLWSQLRMPLSVHNPAERAYDEAYRAYRRWLNLTLAITVIGGLIMTSAFLIPGPPRKGKQRAKVKPGAG